MFAKVHQRITNQHLTPLIGGYIVLFVLYTQIPTEAVVVRAILSKIAIVLMIVIAIVAASKLREWE